MKRFTAWLKKYFIPHAENDHKPHFLRHRAVLIIFLIVIVIELGMLAQVYLVFDKTKFLAAVLPGVLESITNDQRKDAGLPPLTENELLAQAAQMKANDMAEKGYFAHTSPEGKTPWYWFSQVGYKYTYAGENLAVNFFESEDVAEAWMNSPTHRANIVKKDFTEIGIGVAKGAYKGRNSVFVAQLFGTPATVQAPVAAPSAQTQSSETAQTPQTPIEQAPAPEVEVASAPSPVATQVLGEIVDTPPAPAKQGAIRSFIQKILSSPRDSTTFAYAIVLGIIVIALLLAIFIRSEIQHPAMIARGVGLAAAVVLLLVLNIRVLGTDAEVPREGLNANVISAN